MLRSMHIFNSKASIECTLEEVKQETIHLESYSEDDTQNLETQEFRELSLEEQILEHQKYLKKCEDKLRLLKFKKVKKSLEKLALTKDKDKVINEYADDLEAIILYKLRPALTICQNQKGEYCIRENISNLGHVDAYGEKKWEDFLKPHLNDSESGILWNAMRSGRIETGISEYPSWLGSMFLFSSGYAMTNRHVLTYNDFCWHDKNNTVVWSTEVPHLVNFDALYLKSNLKNNMSIFKDVPYMSKPKEYDCAVIKLDEDYLDRALLKSLPIYQGDALSEDELSERIIYVIGHPGYVINNNPPGEMSYVFKGIFDVKRIMPGKLLNKPMGVHNGLNIMYHDCSTLGGASGSCIIDLTPGESCGKVIGLHYAGVHGQHNYAIPIWELRGIWEKYL